jgi:hypothetical protein
MLAPLAEANQDETDVTGARVRCQRLLVDGDERRGFSLGVVEAIHQRFAAFRASGPAAGPEGKGAVAHSSACALMAPVTSRCRNVEGAGA